MDAIKGNIYAILNGNKQFVVPVYQRYYSWEIPQCTRLWNDIVEMQKKGKLGHFVGSIVNIAEQAMPTGVQKYMIIDGQQRITTLTLLLIALRDYAINNPNDTSINYRRIDNMLLKNEYEVGDERFKLLLTEADRKFIIDLIEKKPIKAETKSKIFANYKFFYEKIIKKEITPAEIYESIGKLQIVNITLDRNVDDAQAIFESLNSTGKELSASDLIRNYMLMGLEASEQLYIYEHYWRPIELMFEYNKQGYFMDKFFRDYLTMKLVRIPNRDYVYEDFKQYHLNCEFSTIRELCDELYKCSVYYTNMIFVRNNNIELYKLYKDINDLRMEVAYPFLLKVHMDHANNLITDDELIEVISLCISYVLRRAVCKIPTNSLNKTFATLRGKIRTDDYVNSLKIIFATLNDYKIFPSDEQFIKAFETAEIYRMNVRNYILSHLENYHNRAPINIENYTIEHIMPQNKNLREEWKSELGENWEDVHKVYLHTIGNLTLTAYNELMSDKPFMEKMNMTGGFKESALRINSSLVRCSNWNENMIKKRAQEMSSKSILIWPYPTIPQEILEKYLLNVKKSTSKYSLETYEFNEHTKKLYELLNNRIINLSSAVKKEYKKLYIAYKLDTNFVDVVPQKNRLRLSLNVKYNEINDPADICIDITDRGRWGNGDVEVFFEDISEIDTIMNLVEQAYNMHL